MKLPLALAAFLVFAWAACSVDREFAPAGSQGGGGGGGGGNSGPQTCETNAECASGFCVDGFCCDGECSSSCEKCNLENREGTCSSTCKGGLACEATGCLTSCKKPEDCQPHFTCKGSKCERLPEENCLDGEDDNGDGLSDCEDPTCDTQVECVPAPPVAGEVGLLLASGECPADYDAAQLFHTGLQPNDCTGCGCTTQCASTMQLYSDDNCATTPTTQNFSGPPDFSVVCKNFSQTDLLSAKTTAASVSGCVGSGTATQADPTWATDDTFCGAKSSDTCGAGKVCVAKRTSAPLCVRVDSAASCPAGYTGGESGVYFSDFLPGSCGSCASCNAATTMTCKVGILTSQALTGSNCTGAGDLIGTNCSSLSRGTYRACEMAFDSTGVDNCVSNVTTTPPEATGATRICCQ